MDSAVVAARPADPISSPDQEMDRYCRYLTGQPADAQTRELFARAVAQGHAKLESHEEAARQFILRHPWSLGPVDAAMGFFLPKHGLRRRMILAFAILEANPHFFDALGPKSFSRSHLLTLAGRGAAEVFKLVIGRIVLWLV